jgi:uncharacterized protein
MAAMTSFLEGWGLTNELLVIFAVGFFAQLVDGALGMAFGLLSSTGMMMMGLSPAVASAIVHTAEIATTGASGASHIWFRNIDWRLFRRLAVAGVIGGSMGALLLSYVDGKMIQPFVAAYLLVMGFLVIIRAFRMKLVPDASVKHVPALGLIGGFLDAIGGGGWGPIVTSTLLGSGNAPRQVIGTVNSTEFCVTTAIAIVFLTQLGLDHIHYVIALAAGGLLAAPLGALTVGRVKPRPLLLAVGILVSALALLQLWRSFS